jgi:putative transposase
VLGAQDRQRRQQDAQGPPGEGEERPSPDLRDAAITAFDHFLEKYGAKYEAASTYLSKDRDALLAFYDFPAEHWGHLRTTNPIESTFSPIRLRHRRTKESGSRKSNLTMMFKLAQSASRRWR